MSYRHPKSHRPLTIFAVAEDMLKLKHGLFYETWQMLIIANDYHVKLLYKLFK